MTRRFFQLDPGRAITIATRLRSRVSRGLEKAGLSQDWMLIPLAAIVGVLAGLVAMGFEWMVLSSNHLFARLSHFSDSLLPLIALPALGGLCVGLIQVYISRSPAGHGIPDVVLALRRRRGVMQGRTGVFKAINTSLTLGSGGSAGVEGPIVHIGSVLGSVVGQTLKLNKDQMSTLVGCGAAAGLASIFNAPIAGVIFVLEVILRDFSLRTFTPIVIASVFGTALAQAMLGHNEALFMLPSAPGHGELGASVYSFTLAEIGHYAVLGVLCALVGVGFTRLMIVSEHGWGRLKMPRALKPALGGALLGVLGVGFVRLFGDPVPAYSSPPFFANGYPVIESLFNPASYNASAFSVPDMPVAQATLGFLVAAMALKMLGTSLTLGSGGAGGVFAPSLFMGATLGGAFGLALQQMGLLPGATPATYALAGMAGVLAATVHCPLSAFLLVFELTRDYKVILPVMLVAIVATTIAQMLFRHSTYTHVLAEMGFRFANYSDLAVLQRLTVDDVSLTPAVITRPTDPAHNLLKLAENPLVEDFVVCDEKGQYLGLVTGEELRTALLGQEALPLLVVGDLLRTDPPLVAREDALDAVLDKFSQHDVASLAVVQSAQQSDQVLGMISRSRLMRRYHQALEQS
jgi:CIC family chloride channel protein